MRDRASKGRAALRRSADQRPAGSGANPKLYGSSDYQHGKPQPLRQLTALPVGLASHAAQRAPGAAAPLLSSRQASASAGGPPLHCQPALHSHPQLRALADLGACAQLCTPPLQPRPSGVRQHAASPRPPRPALRRARRALRPQHRPSLQALCSATSAWTPTSVVRSPLICTQLWWCQTAAAGQVLVSDSARCDVAAASCRLCTRAAHTAAACCRRAEVVRHPAGRSAQGQGSQAWAGLARQACGQGHGRIRGPQCVSRARGRVAAQSAAVPILSGDTARMVCVRAHACDEAGAGSVVRYPAAACHACGCCAWWAMQPSRLQSRAVGCRSASTHAPEVPEPTSHRLPLLVPLPGAPRWGRVRILLIADSPLRPALGRLGRARRCRLRASGLHGWRLATGLCCRLPHSRLLRLRLGCRLGSCLQRAA